MLASVTGFEAPTRVLRLAHLTDLHVQPEGGAPEGFEQALNLAQAESPDLLLMGGDLVMDSLGCDRDRLKAQWDVYTGVLERNAKTRVVTCLGNHDVWGWGDRARLQNEPEFGKRYAQDRLGLERAFYSFDQARWHFVVLDSTYPVDGDGYTARLHDEQFEWLASDLAAIADETPVLILSHIPIFAACCFLHGENERTGEWQVPGAWMHLDVRRIQGLFLRHPNVKVCLSGHMHLSDRVDYLGVTYYCNPAVCAGWWGGPFHEFQNAFSVVDLFADGSVTNRIVEF
jgi:3',5'-cyclic AMP phosphodiesterase CpdA